MKKNSDQEDDFYRFKNLMRAISESPIKDTLQELNLRKCGIGREKCKNMIKSLGMKIVTLRCDD